MKNVWIILVASAAVFGYTRYGNAQDTGNPSEAQKVNVPDGGTVLGPGARHQTDDARVAVQNAASAYVAAYNARDAAKLATLWSETAVYVLPDTGESIVGRESIQKMFGEMFEKSPNARLTVNIDSIRFVSPDVALESGRAEMLQADGAIDHSRYSAVYTKQNDQWLLDSVHDVVTTSELTAPNPLAELEWMVGDWVDHSDESSVETVCQWTKNHKFLTRTFRVSAQGIDDLEGTQVIGWDPLEGAIRSWVFDSDGGFSTGIWKRDGDKWVVESTGFLAEGLPVSSVQVFARVDADSFGWQSFGRRVGTETLPNIDEIKVSRK